jgi:hypothetical protein
MQKRFYSIELIKKEVPMKTLKISVAIFAMAFFSLEGLTVSAQEKGSSTATRSYEYEKSRIDNDLANIQTQNEMINKLKENRKKIKASRDEESLNENKLLIAKAEADLSRYKAYLHADKDQLLYAYKLAIDDRKKQLQRDKDRLVSARASLEKTLARGEAASASRFAAMVARYNNEVKNDEAALDKERTDRNADILALNKKIEKYEGQSFAVLYAENAVASVKNINFNRLPR